MDERVRCRVCLCRRWLLIRDTETDSYRLQCMKCGDIGFLIGEVETKWN